MACEAFTRRAAVLLLAGTVCPGCSHGPTLPGVSPRRAAGQALKAYDTDADGRITREEASADPAIARILLRMDRDQDGVVNRDEIASRVRGWCEGRSRVMPASTEFSLDGEPLVGAEVTLEPALFLPAYPTITATTDQRGRAALRLTEPNLPGVYTGAYKVRVSKRVDGQETLPARYNAETQLGLEVSEERWLSGLFGFRLRSDEPVEAAVESG